MSTGIHYRIRTNPITGERMPSLTHTVGTDDTLTICGKRIRGWAWQKKSTGEVTCKVCLKGEQKAYKR